MQISKIEEVAIKKAEDSSIVVFGGTFDPVHQGHLGAIASLKGRFSTVIIAPTKSNPWKESEATSLEIRLDMFRRLFPEITEYSNLKQPKGKLDDLILWTQEYSFAYQVVDCIRLNLPNNKLMWAIGEDLIDEVNKWKHWQKKGVPAVVVPITPNIHASDIRAGRAPLLPELEELAEKHKLYRD